jgi:phage terminase large subunit-like protein
LIVPVHPGRNGGGRPTGVRNQLSRAFLEDLHSNWKEHGAKTIDIVRKHHPETYVRVVAGLLPKEFVFESALVDIDDDELMRITERLRMEVLEEQQQIRKAENKLADYLPYPKQREFHAAGAKYRERLAMTCNRFGKTVAGAMEMTFHLTGQYPDWWEGKRFDKSVRAWAAGVTGETTRDVVQGKLIGPPTQSAEWGTGTIPKSALGNIVTSRGIPGAIDTVSVHHVSGGMSELQFKSYERGREKWQGAALEVVWCDEEPDHDIYIEGLTRTNETGGIVYLTMTPLLGVSNVVQRFQSREHPGCITISATIDDVLHFSEADKAAIIASYKPHEREARVKGVPALGSGRIFPVAEETIACEHREIPSFWPCIGGIDFGWDHPFAAVELAWDRDTDTVYVTRTYRIRETTPIIHAAALREWGKSLPWSWPRDGRRETLEGAGKALADQYERQGLDMLFEHAQFEDGSVSVEAGLAEMLSRMQTGRFKVFKHLNDWFEEFRLYHRRDGKVFKEGDDLMAATRYGLMMLRHARSETGYRNFYREIVYPGIGIV